MFCSCRISTDKCLARYLCHSRATCQQKLSMLSLSQASVKPTAKLVWSGTMSFSSSASVNESRSLQWKRATLSAHTQIFANDFILLHEHPDRLFCMAATECLF